MGGGEDEREANDSSSGYRRSRGSEESVGAKFTDNIVITCPWCVITLLGGVFNNGRDDAKLGRQALSQPPRSNMKSDR